uniref:Uncharacterized protein n=2 Tax=viral metagenome TaxID=1070528 RepID=A0A6M3ITR3_9ZZZZ
MTEASEITTPAAETAVTEQVTDADLSAAWESEPVVKTEEVKTEPIETAEEKTLLTPEEKGAEGELEVDDIPDEPADNRDRSRLGRRMKSLEDTLTSLASKLDGIAKPAVETGPVVAPGNVTYGDEYMAQQIEEAKEAGIIPDIITTPEDIIATNTFVNRVNQSMQLQYAQGYLGEVARLKTASNVPEKLHTDILAELQSPTSPFNTRHVNNPVIDARINYAEAKAFLLEKSIVTPGTVFKGKETGATGVTASTRTETKTDEMPALDDKANEFIRLTGMNPESVKAALKEPMPWNLRGAGGTR